MLAAAVLLAAGAASAAPPAKDPGAARTKWTPVTVVYLSDTRAKLDQCGCKSNPRGGVVRRATYMNQLWNEGVTPLVLEGGDLFGKRDRKEQQDTEFLCEQTAAFGTDAIGLGEYDLNYGVDFLRQTIAKDKLPFTNANVRDGKTGELLLPEFLVVTKNGIRFGIVSVLDPDLKIITMNPQEGEFRVDDPVTTLRTVLPRLRKLCDSVVLIAHTGDQKMEEILKGVAGIDIVQVGHTSKNWETERIINDAVVVAAAFEGRYVGRADVGIDPANGKVMSVEVKVTGLDATIPDDPSMAEKLAKYKTARDQAKAEQRARWPRDRGSADQAFLGIADCRSCHEATYATWHDSGHARSHGTLQAKNMATEPECLACHTTGYRYQGGFEEEGEGRTLVNIQCEACHGYGTEHARDGKLARKAKDSCTECHDDSQRPCRDQTGAATFDYASYWEKIKH